MEMKKVLEQEGRDAKNLLVLQFCVEDALNTKHKSNKKPPTAPKSPLSMLGSKKHTEQHKNGTTGPRIRSASTGRDKKSELQARYWALLFGNLQRAINEIYQTVECYENMSACQETILVLENYIRDFKALAEWFRVSWNYELTPQRPQSLAWEVRKSNPTPRVRAKSLTSPNISGKSSPCYSGKSSPCPPNEQAKNVISPRKSLKSMESLQKGATRVNIRELFCSKSSKKPSEVPKSEELSSPKESEILNMNKPAGENSNETSLSWVQLIEKYLITDTHQQNDENVLLNNQNLKCDQYAQTDLEDENLTLAEIREKLRQQELNQQTKPEVDGQIAYREPTAVELTVQKMNSMEDDLLLKQSQKPQSLPISEIKKIEPITTPKTKPIASVTTKTLSEQVPFFTTTPSTIPMTLPAVKKSQNSPMKYSSVLNRPANNRFVGVAKVQSNRSLKPVCTVQAQRPATASGQAWNYNSNTRSTVKSHIGVKNQPPFNGRQVVQAPLVRNKSNLVRSDRYVPSNVENRLSARSRTMIEINDRRERNMSRQPLATNLKRTSRDDISSSSSTLKASNEKINGSKVNISDGGRSSKNSEPKQISNDSNNDGWLTVKTRRRSSLHWANRFNQPTGYTSLPTLALLNEKEESTAKNMETPVCDTDATNNTKASESNKKPEIQLKKEERVKPLRPEIKNAKAKVNSLPIKNNSKPAPNIPATKTTTKTNGIPSKGQSSILLTVSGNVTNNTRQNNIKRQKSDLTGLKITSLHKEYMRSEKFHKVLSSRNNNLEANDILLKETVVLKDEVGGCDVNGNDDAELNKIDIKIQTNREFSKTIGDLYDSMSNAGFNNVLSSCEECEERDDLESDEDQRKLLEEQESLERQIFELQNTEIDVDTETDETDCEVMIDQDDYHEETLVDGAGGDCMVFVDDENMSLEMRYQALLSGMSWGEREEALATLQAYVSRHPGRAQELHQKLSNPSRRRSLQETLKKYQAKQARAQQKRELLQKDKAQKIQQLLIRVEYVKAAKQQLIDERRLKMEERLQRATEKRNNYLRQIVEKAHDEEKKLKEINFIKNIEAQNKRLDLIESSKETEGRLQDIEQERQKRVEEKAAKEAAVERRRQELEQERQRRLEKMNEYRLEREQRIGKMQEQREKQRREIAREKARDREERLLALQVQQQQTTEELQRKILQKQMESARRHEENIEQIRQRALELTIPTRTVDEAETRLGSEDGHLSSTLSDVGREHTKGFKKKMKKLKSRMAQRSEEYMKGLTPLALHIRRESEVPKFLNIISKGGGPHGLERPLGQLLRLLAKAQINDFQCFWLLDGLGILADVITKGMEPNSPTSRKSIVLAAQLYRNACSLCPQIARHSLLGNSIIALFDAVLKSIQLPEEKSPHHPVELSTELMLASTVALSPSNTTKHINPKVLERLPDLTSYAVSTGLIEILSKRCMEIKESVETQQSVVLSLLTTLGLLSKFVEICPSAPTDPSKFLSVAKSTELFGTISMLYACVLPIGEYIEPRTVSLSASTFSLFMSMSVLNYTMFQEILSSESLSLRLLDVITILFKYFHSITAAEQKEKEIQGMIIDIIGVLGFFCLNNKRNQNLLTREHNSYIIKSIAKLPEEFSVLVYPCLVTIIYKNEEARKVVANDFNVDLIDEYSKSEKSKKNALMALLK